MTNVRIAENDIPTQTWDISESIPQLAYLTHNFFRYYGKFPSVLARDLIKEFALPSMTILDNYAGSGTTLVEAKLAGFNSFGVDINPFAILACRVKCRSYSLAELNRRWNEFSDILAQHYSFLLANDNFAPHMSGFTYDESYEVAQKYMPISTDSKWFTEKTKLDLALLKSCLLQLPLDEFREFFTLAYTAIIRRVSKAYDGEIRPHVNPKKNQRSVWKAYTKKLKEMIEREHEWIVKTDPAIWSVSALMDNRTLSEWEVLKEYPVGMIVSHPPYLNSFDYLPAYSLEFQWAEGFPEIWGDSNLELTRKLEIRAWPATNPELFKSYFDNQKLVLEEAYKVLVNGGVCCMVVGDATIRGELIPVHKMVAEIGQSIGFKIEQVVYRTTHYGVGKYAYNHRADYHEDGGKKDGVLIFRK